jgi:hypothetical protein
VAWAKSVHDKSGGKVYGTSDMGISWLLPVVGEHDFWGGPLTYLARVTPAAEQRQHGVPHQRPRAVGRAGRRWL